MAGPDPASLNNSQAPQINYAALNSQFQALYPLQYAFANYFNLQFQVPYTNPVPYPSSVFIVEVLSYGNSPVLLDLSGNGISITQLSSSNTYFDTAGDGYQHRTAWAGAGNGVLIYDTNGDGKITQANQINFTLWDPSAKSDMQALLDVFDTNHNGKLDAGDSNFAKFKVLVSNADGTQTLRTLTELGIASINLVENAASITLPDGSSIDGQTTYTRTDGSTGGVATVTLASEAQGYKINQTITHNADGSTTIDNKTLNPDGSLATETITVRSADGKTRNLSFDDNGDGVVDRIQTDIFSTGTNGAVSETVSNYRGASLASAYLLDRTVTTTTASAGGKTVSIDRDTDGDGLFDQNETQATSASGILTLTITNYNPNGSVIDQATRILTSNGLNRFDAIDLDGDGVINLIKTDNTVINADQSRTETVSDLSANGTLFDQTVTTTSANGATKTVSYDHNGDGVVDQTSSLVISAAANGSSVTTQKHANHDGSLIGASQTTISSDGLSTVTLIDSFGVTDASHNPVYDLQNSDVTVVNADQSRTQTLSSYIYANGAPTKLVRQAQIIKGADGITRTTKVNGNGALDAQNNPIWSSIETVTVDAAHNNNVVDTLKIINPDGTLSSETVTTTSADGLTVTFQSDQGGKVDAGGNPIFDHVQTIVTTKNADKSSTVVSTTMAGDGHTVIDTTTTTTSADGLTVRTTSNTGGDNTTTTDTTTVYADGRRREIVQVTAPGAGTNPTPVVLSTIEIDTSSDQKTTFIKEDTNGDGVFDRVTAQFIEVSGAMVEEILDFAPDGSLISKTQKLTSANGLATTVMSNIDGKIDSVTTDVTALNMDGSFTETITTRANDGTLISQTTKTTSGNGFASTTTTSVDGKVDSTVSDITSIATNGDQIEVITTYDPQHAKINATRITSSANGLLKTALIDENGDGIFDIQATDQKTLNVTDGSVTALVTTTTVAGSPVTLGRTQTVTSADGLTVIGSADHTGNGVYDEVTKVVQDPAGNAVTTVDHYDPNNRKINETVTTTHGNGLFKQIKADVNGDGTFDRTRNDSIALNQDGSQTETVTTLAGTATVGTTVVTTNANGTMVTTQKYNGTAATDTLVETDQSQTTYNLDGTITKNSTAKSRNGAVIAQSTTQISADLKTTTTTTNFLQTTFAANQTEMPESSLETLSVQADGSLKDTVKYYASPTVSGTLLASKTTQASANGLSKTLSWDLNGDGTNDETQSYTITLGTDGSKTETFTESDAFPGTSFSENVVVTTVTSANGLTSSASSSINLGKGTSTVNGSRTGSINPDGSVVVVTTDAVTVRYGANVVYSGSDASVVTTSRDGLTKTTQVSTWGNNTFYRTHSVTTHLDGSTTETITNLNDDNSVGEAKTVNVSADGRTITVTDLTSDRGLTNYLVQSTIPTNDGSNNAIYLTTTSNYRSNGGTLLNKETESTLLNGLSKTTTLDANGDGTVDETKTDVTTLSPDGKTIETIRETDAFGTQIKQQVVTTSADGLHKTVTIAGSGTVLATTQTDTVLNADGSTTTTAITTSPGAAGSAITRNKTIISASGDGRVANVTWDLDGDGLKDAAETSVSHLDGAKTVSDTYYQPDGTTVSSVVTTTTSANGRMTTVSRTINASPASNTTETTLLSADGSGSYSWTERDAGGNELVYANHIIDQNDIDYVDLWVRGTEVTYRISADQEAKDLAQVQSIYTVVLGRTMSPEEMQTWLKYYTNSGLDVVQLADDLMNSAEFWQNGTPSWDPTTFINLVYDNAFGRLPNGAEFTFWYNKISGAQPVNPNPAVDYGSQRSNFAVEIARVANPAGVANAQFNLQATSPYPLPFGAGGGGGGGVSDSITTYSSTYGTIITHYDPLTGFVRRANYYNGSLDYLTDYYDTATGKITSEDGFYYNQSGTQINVAYRASGNTIDFYAPIAYPNYLFGYGNKVLGITNNSDGSSTWNYQKYAGDGSANYVWGTIVYSGNTTINRFSGLNASGYVISSNITDLSTGNNTIKTLSGGVGSYLVTEYHYSGSTYTQIASGYDKPGNSSITYYNPSRFGYASAVTSLNLQTSGPDTSGVVSSAYFQTIYGTFLDVYDSAGNFTQTYSSNYGGVITTKFAANGTYLSGGGGQPPFTPSGYYFYGASVYDPNAIYISGAYFGAGLGGKSYGSPLASELPGGISIQTNTTFTFATAPGAGSATGTSNAPTTPAGGFTFTVPTLNPTKHIIDTAVGFVSGTGGDTFIYNAGYGSVEIDENDPSQSPENILKLGSTILPSNIRVTADSSGNLYITDGTVGDGIKLAGMLSDKSRGVQSVQFTSNNTSWTRAQLIEVETTGTSAADRLYGTSGMEIFDGKGGNDYASGRGGGDTLVYRSGYGLLEIDEHDLAAAPNNVLEMSGISSAKVTVISDGTNIYLTDRVAGDLIRIDNMAGNASFGIQTVQLADTTWHRSDLLSRVTNPIFGSASGADALGGTSGANYIDGRGAAAGQIDVITGGGGNDLFIYNKGYGSLEINEIGIAGDQSILMLGPSITLQTVTIQYDPAGNLILTDGVAGDQIKLDGYFSSSNYGPQVIQFADGTYLTKANMFAMARPLPLGTYRVGSEFLVNTTTALSQTNATITGLANGNFVVSWRNEASRDNNWQTSIRAQIFNSTGDKLGNEFVVINQTQGMMENPSISALASGGFVATWQGGSIQAQVFDSTGARIGSTFRVDQTGGIGFTQIKPAVTGLANGNFVVTWQDGFYDGDMYLYGTDPDSFVIRGQMYDRNGAPIGSQFQVNAPTSYDQEAPAIAALAGGGFAITWQSDNDWNIKAQVFDASANKLGSEITVDSQAISGTMPSITRLTNGGFVVTWLDSHGNIDAQVFDASGSKVGGVAQVPLLPGYTSGYYSPAIALASGGFVVTWKDNAGSYGDASGSAIMAQEFDSSGNKVGSEFLVNSQTAGYQIDPAIAALSNGGFAITWQDGIAYGDAGSGTLGDTSGSSIKAQVFGISTIGTVIGTSGNDTLLGIGAATLIGNGGNDTYRIDATQKPDTIINGITASTSPSGTLQLTSASPNQLWFDRVGNDLAVDVLGTAQMVTIQNWYGSDGAKLGTLQAGNNVLSTSQVDTLIQAMTAFEARYATAHGGIAFDPKTAGSTISDAAVLASVNSAWHQAA